MNLLEEKLNRAAEGQLNDILSEVRRNITRLCDRHDMESLSNIVIKKEDIEAINGKLPAYVLLDFLLEAIKKASITRFMDIYTTKFISDVEKIKDQLNSLGGAPDENTRA